MELFRTKANKQQITPADYEALAEEMLLGFDRVDAIIEQVSKLPYKGKYLRHILDVGFKEALIAQVDAQARQGDDTTGIMQQRADFISLIAGNAGLGMHKAAIRNEYDPTYRPRVTGREFKLLQANANRKNAVALGDGEVVAAIDRYLTLMGVHETASLDEIIASEMATPSEDGGFLVRNKNKLLKNGVKVTTALAVTAMTFTASATSANAEDENRDYLLPGEANPDHADESNSKNKTYYDTAAETRRAEGIDKTLRGVASAEPFQLANPKVIVSSVPRVDVTAPPAAKVDGTFRLTTVGVSEAPARVEVSAPTSQPFALSLPPIEQPVQPPAAAPAPKAAPSPEVSVPTNIQDVLLDTSLAGETFWSEGELEAIKQNLPVYLDVQAKTGVPWEMQAAIHKRETNLSRINPGNGQGLYQFFAQAGEFAPGEISDEEFQRQTMMLGEFVVGKMSVGIVGGELSIDNPDLIKDLLFSYNGRAQAYADQAARLGFDLPAEGSPYVMNLADDDRNSQISSGWGQILTDNGPLGQANMSPGAWPLIEDLMYLNKKGHDKAAAEAQRIAEEQRLAAEAEKLKFTGWHMPVQPGTIVNEQYPGHTGIDFKLNTGNDFYATIGGVVRTEVINIANDPGCHRAIANTGNDMSVISDPDQKQIIITSEINGDIYETIYAHLESMSVTDGQIVGPGELIGKTGDSGCSTGPHAHFEIKKNGESIAPAIVQHELLGL